MTTRTLHGALSLALLLGCGLAHADLLQMSDEELSETRIKPTRIIASDELVDTIYQQQLRDEESRSPDASDRNPFNADLRISAIDTPQLQNVNVGSDLYRDVYQTRLSLSFGTSP